MPDNPCLQIAYSADCEDSADKGSDSCQMIVVCGLRIVPIVRIVQIRDLRPEISTKRIEGFFRFS